MNLSQSTLKELVHYNPTTGVFVRRAASGTAKDGDPMGCVAHGYLQASVNGKPYLLHRLAFLYMTGSFPPDQVDHINHKRDDNRWINLRHATRTENLRNATLSNSNTSGHTGVYWNKASNKWNAMIQINGTLKHLGFFDDKNEAIATRKAANKKHGFHPNHGY